MTSPAAIISMTLTIVGEGITLSLGGVPPPNYSRTRINFWWRVLLEKIWVWSDSVMKRYIATSKMVAGYG